MVDQEFERIKVIGKGSYGEVWLAKHRKDKKQYVLKKMNLGKASKRERKSAEQEAKLLSKLKHPNIVSYKDSFETDSGFLFIAMQYCEGGDLYARLKEQKGVALEERQVVEWFVQIAMALQYMHERNILHRDLKTQNIFLTKSKIIKVGDLGIARVLDNAGDMATTLIGTPYYMSPELFSNKPYNHKSDVWALGCCVYEMTTLKHAFNAKDMNSLVYKILKGRMPPMPRQYSGDLLVLMKSMLHQDPEKRPSVNRILRDPYIKRNIALFLEDTKKNSRRPSTTNSSATPASSRPSSASGRRDQIPSTPGPPERPPSSSRSESETNSINSQPKAQDQASDAVPKPSHARKPSDSSARELEPIREKQEENHKVLDSKGQEGGTPAKEVSSPKKEALPRKKKFSLLNHANKGKPDEAEEKEPCKAQPSHSKPPVNQPKVTKANGPEPQKPRLRPEDKSRPLPVPPKAEESSGLPQMRDGEGRSKSTDSSKSSSVSSSREDNCISIDADTPRQFKVCHWPKEDYGKFYSGDSYIILKTYKEGTSEELKFDLHFWIGKESTQDEYGTAAYKTVELDTLLDDLPVQHREVEGHESERFKSYFKSITTMKGGAKTGFRHVEPEKYKPRLLHFCGQRKHVEIKEVPLCKSRINSGDVFILDLGRKVYQWNGSGSNKDERFKAAGYCQQLESERCGRAETEVLEESRVDQQHPFFKALVDDDEDDDGSEFDAKDSTTETYRLSDASGKMNFKLETKGPVSQSQLDSKDVFVIDTKNSVFVWIGKQTSKTEKKKAMQYAHEYLMKTDHPLVSVTCLAEGRENSEFRTAIAA